MTNPVCVIFFYILQVCVGVVEVWGVVEEDGVVEAWGLAEEEGVVEGWGDGVLEVISVCQWLLPE